MNKKMIGAVLGTLAFGGMNLPARAEEAPAPAKEKKAKKKPKGEKPAGEAKAGEKSCGADGKGCSGDKKAK